MAKDYQKFELRLPPDLHEQLRRVAFETRQSIHSLIMAAVEEKYPLDTRRHIDKN